MISVGCLFHLYCYLLLLILLLLFLCHGMPEFFVLVFISWIMWQVMMSLLTFLSLNAYDGGVLVTDL